MTNDDILDSFELDYKRLVTTLQANLNGAELIVRPYERDQLWKGNIVDDFCDACGISRDDRFVLPKSNPNPSLGRKEAEFLRLCNHANLPDRIRTELCHVLILHSRLLSGKEDTFLNHGLLPNKRLMAIYERVSDGNRDLARTVLGRAEGNLFEEPLPEDTEPSVEPHDFDDAKVGDLMRLFESKYPDSKAQFAQAFTTSVRSGELDGCGNPDLLQTINSTLGKTKLKRKHGVMATVKQKVRNVRAARNLDLVRQSEFFDEEWYLRHNEDVRHSGMDAAEHYCVHGWYEGRNPSPKFDTNAYLNDHPDLAFQNQCPLLHFIKNQVTKER